MFSINCRVQAVWCTNVDFYSKIIMVDVLATNDVLYDTGECNML